MRITTSACIDAPIEVVWDHLARLDQIPLWTDAVHRATMTGQSCGVGAERVCELGADRRLHERIIDWDEGHSFTYVSTDAPGMRTATNRWEVRPADGRTLVTSVADVELRGGIVGRWLGWLLVPLMALLLPNPLAKLKYWIENGEPYVGSARSLPAPRAIC